MRGCSRCRVVLCSCVNKEDYAGTSLKALELNAVADGHSEIGKVFGSKASDRGSAPPSCIHHRI